MKADYYSILEISPNATEEVAHAAYRALAKLYSDDGAKMRALNEAKEVIFDKDKRAEYDNNRTIKKGKIIGNYRTNCRRRLRDHLSRRTRHAGHASMSQTYPLRLAAR